MQPGIIEFMRANFRWVGAGACVVVLLCPFAWATSGRKKTQEQKLAAKIEREKNPGKKARLQVRLARLKLKEANKAYLDRHFTEGESLLQQYLQQVRHSWNTLQGAKDVVRKHMRALQDLEISLRENDRFLGNLRRAVPYPESEAIKAVAKESSEVHEKVLEVIFPTGFRPRRGIDRLLHPKRLAPAKPRAKAKPGA